MIYRCEVTFMFVAYCSRRTCIIVYILIELVISIHFVLPNNLHVA